MSIILWLRKSDLGHFLLISLFFTLISLIVTWPLVVSPANLIIDRFDGLLIAWFLNWDLHAIANGFHSFHEWVNFFNANIFYPYKGTLAFSEHMLPQALIAAPWVLIFKEPLLAYNINFLGGFIFTGMSLYYLVRFLTKDSKISLLTAALFTFSTIHLHYMAHLQLFNIWPVILTTLFLLRRNYKLYALCFIIACLTTALNLYFLLLIVFVVVLFGKSRLKPVLLATGVAGVLLLPFLLPYFWVSKQFNYVRPITDAIHFSLHFQSLANISNINRISTLLPSIANTTPAYPGVTFMVLIGVLGVALYRSVKNKKISVLSNISTKPLLIFITVSVASFILSLGPALHLETSTVHIGPFKAIPLPYMIFYYLLPGFSGFRTPSRWILLTFLSLAIAIGLILKRRLSSLQVALLVLLILLEIQIPFKYETVPSVKEFPPEQYWLSQNLPGKPIIQFPIYNWSDQGPDLSAAEGFGLETLREYYSTIHFHPMFNGYSGFSPQVWQDKVFWLQKEFPSGKTISYLKSLNIRLVLVPRSWENRLTAFPELTLIKKFPQTEVFELK